VESAIDQVSNEAAFFSLRGDIRREMDSTDEAMSDYSRAVELYPEMFRYRLNRGLLHHDLENWDSAEKDLKASLESVPTSIAYLGLGDAVAAQGRQSEAKQYYQQAAQDQGKIGELARQRLEAMGVKEPQARTISDRGRRVVLSGKLRSHGWRRAAYRDVLVAIPGKNHPPPSAPRKPTIVPRAVGGSVIWCPDSGKRVGECLPGTAMNTSMYAALRHPWLRSFPEDTPHPLTTAGSGILLVEGF